MKNLFTLLAFLLAFQLSAQKFIKPSTERPITFTEMQRQYNDWKKTVDLKKIKGWKYFSRWEEDMLLHTNAQGEIADPTDYINAAIDVANQKQAASSRQMTSAAWYPVGPNAVPNNLTGYMENGIGRINCIAFHPTNATLISLALHKGECGKQATTEHRGLRLLIIFPSHASATFVLIQVIRITPCIFLFVILNILASDFISMEEKEIRITDLEFTKPQMAV